MVPSFFLSLGILAMGLVGVASGVSAEVTRVGDWTVNPKFGKSAEVGRELSGAACATRTSCLVVNDEKKYAQFFAIAGRTLVPGRLIRLLPDELGGEKMKEIDAEGVAFEQGRNGAPSFYYVAGSHGATRDGDIHPSSFFLFRIPVEVSTGLPAFALGDDGVAREIDRSSNLRAAIRSHPTLAPDAEKNPENGGVSVEGLAVAGGRLFLGLRSPAPDGIAYILSVPSAAAFGGVAPRIEVAPVGLEKGAGIRDIAAVGGGFLLLSGQSTNRPRPGEPVVAPAIWFWDGNSGSAQKLGALPGENPADKAETLLVLDEAGASYRVLVLFDGAPDGRPVEFRVRR